MEISLTPFVCSVDTAAAAVADIVAVCLVSIDIRRLRVCMLLHRLSMLSDIRNDALHSHSA